MGARLMAIVAEGDRGRVYLAPVEHEAIRRHGQAGLEAGPQICRDRAPMLTVYRCTGCRHSDAFTPRQLVALTTFSDLVTEARARVERDAIVAGLPDDSTPLRDGGTGATAYAEAVGVYLAFAVEQAGETLATLVRWEPIEQCPRDSSVAKLSP